MECFGSIWLRSQKAFEKEKQNLEDDGVDLQFVTFKGGNQVCYC